VAGTCEYGNELSGSIECEEFLDWLQNQLASQYTHTHTHTDIYIYIYIYI
jgi:hypothetical protein